MPLKITLNTQTTPPEPEPQASVSLHIARSLGGNLIISDHEFLDILIDPTKNKIITLPKPSAEEDVFSYQQEIFYDLFKKGLIAMPEPQAAASYGVLEAEYPSTDDTEVDPLQSILYQLEKIIQKTATSHAIAHEYDEHIEDRFTDPPEGEYTPYGSIPPYQDTPAGSRDTYNPTYGYAGYGYLY